MRPYEVIYILDPGLEDARQAALVERFSALLSEQGATVDLVDRWERRRLAYEIAGRREGLIWAGTITKIFSVFECINFIKAFPEFSLVLKGAIPLYTKNEIEMNYKELITSGRIVIDSEYLSAPEYIKYVSNFRIGFCFYDWNLIKNDFNYQTAPSGKLFVYLSAGLPVIVCNIPGFKFIEDYQAGILINDYKPETILNAIKIIEANYSLYQNNCYRAFNDFCFNKNVEAFKLFLLMDD